MSQSADAIHFDPRDIIWAHLTDRAKSVLYIAWDDALRRGQNYIGIEHIVAAIPTEQGQHEA